MAVKLYEEEEAPSVSKVREYTGELAEAAPAVKKTGLNLRKELARQLGLTARAGITGLSGIGGAIADFGVGAANLAGANLPLPSQELQKSMTKLGLPEPRGALENVVQFGSSVLAGAGDPGAVAASRYAGSLAPKGFQPPQATAKANTVQELHNAGVVLPPTAAGGGKTSRALEGLGGSPHIANTARFRNQPTFQNLAARETHLDPTNLTETAIRQANQQVAKEGYEPVRQLGTLRLYGQSPVSRFSRALDHIQARYNTIDDASHIRHRISQLRTRTMDADDLLERVSQLRSDASDAFRNGKSNYGKALREIADTTEAQIERNLPANSPMLAKYREARVQLAKNLALKDMLVDPDTGLVSTAKAAKLRADGTKLTGGLETIAKAGDAPFVKATDAPIGGEGVPFNLGDSLYTGGLVGGTGALGWALGGPMGGALLGAGALAARMAARPAVLSGPMQRSLVRQGSGLFDEASRRVVVGGAPQLAEVAKHLFPTFSQGDQ